MRKYRLTIMCLLSLSLLGCAQENRYVSAFTNTKSYELAKAIEKSDLNEIERLVKEDPALMEFPNPMNGSNALVLSLKLDKLNSFKKILELGANPNFINPYDKHSVLLYAIEPIGSQFEWRKANEYIDLLLKYGANPNYSINNDFISEKGNRVSATSPLMEASALDLETVKTLIKKGADPHKKIGEQQFTSFSKAVRRGKIDIINYYIDSLGIDIHQPMSTVIQKPNHDTVTYYIQDYIVNKFTKAKIMGDSLELERLKRKNEGIEEANQDLWLLIKKLEGMGVDFKNYNYKL